MSAAVTRRGAVDIAYETFGSPSGEPLLLMMGLGAQMLLWEDGFCTELVRRGFAVARFDYRDVGSSTHFASTTSYLRALLRQPYRLDDLVNDGLAVMDALEWETAHLVGMSLGGYMAQLTATRDPSRVRALTLMTTFPGWHPRYINYRSLFALARRLA